jgi:Secretion system C-terminal sorting domain
MKKFLLLLLLIFSVVVIFAQTVPTPCAAGYKINNGGGSCPDLNGVEATGSIELSFDEPVDPNHLPIITSVQDITDPSNPITIIDNTFREGVLLNNGKVKYCYYVGPANDHNLVGRHRKFRFTVSYQVAGGGLIICGAPFPLPVNFKSFTAARNKNIVALKWTTASENNNLGFEIQRLVGGSSWQTVSFIYTQATGGNSGSDLNYSYNDLNSTKGVTQYRIRQVDIDQKSRYSEIRAVRGDGQSGKTIVFPNPVLSGGKINVVFEDAVGTRDVSLIDLNGRQVRQWKAVTNNNLQIENLTPGFYNLKVIVRETGEQTIEKIVVNKN